MAAASTARNTATFQPYFWEAYNEIVQPRRFDHYLLHRWLPELGQNGFVIVKVLRDRCYHNPQTGVLRDSVEVDLDELARACQMSRRTLLRELSENAMLGQFVRRIKQYQMVDGRPRQRENLYQVSMDDPVHPQDLARYDELRAEKERDRHQPAPRKIVHAESKPYGGQNDPHRKKPSAYEGQNGTPDPTGLQSHIGTPDPTGLPGQNGTAYVNSPSGGSIPSASIPPGAGEAPPINSPQGEEEGSRSSAATSSPPDVAAELRDSLLCGAWRQALKALETQINRPTFEAHLKPLRPLALDEPAGTVELLCPSHFAREWLDKRHRPAIEQALSAALGRAVLVRLATPAGSSSVGSSAAVAAAAALAVLPPPGDIADSPGDDLAAPELPTGRTPRVRGTSGGQRG